MQLLVMELWLKPHTVSRRRQKGREERPRGNEAPCEMSLAAGLFLRGAAAHPPKANQ